MNPVTLARIANIERLIEQGHERDRLYAPLVQFLHPKWYAAQMCGIGVQGMSIHLRGERWKKQREAGIDRCLGFDVVFLP